MNVSIPDDFLKITEVKIFSLHIVLHFYLNKKGDVFFLCLDENDITATNRTFSEISLAGYKRFIQHSIELENVERQILYMHPLLSNSAPAITH